MTTRNRRPPAARAPLSKELVLRTAIAMADRDGLDVLSMRSLASELGYQPMSLYNHVANKDEILDALVEAVTAEIELAEDDDWRASLRSTVLSAHQVLLRHPWCVTLWPTTTVGPSRLAFMESLLRTMREHGVPPSLAYHGYHALIMHVLGAAFLRQHLPIDAASVQRGAASFATEMADRGLPHLVEHMHQHLDGSERDDDFDVVLDLLLDGMVRALELSGEGERPRRRRAGSSPGGGRQAGGQGTTTSLPRARPAARSASASRASAKR